VSIACWIVVYSPQIYENYSLQSGEGLSVLFVVIWLLGDISNAAGALLAGLLPTVIIIAFYYTLCDVTLMFQIYYYRWKKARIAPSSEHGEASPLIPRNIRDPPQKSSAVIAFRYAGALAFVCATGIIAWWISNHRTSRHRTAPHPPSEGKLAWTIQILGWTSAVLYLGARLPQIAKNFKTRCEGLSPALFFFAIFGNVTYSCSILAKSTDRQYLITNASWLAGSGLTVFLDLIVLCQFFYYRSVRERYVRVG